MITVEQLAGVLGKYGLNVEKVLSQNDNILTKGSYDEIEYVLSYLINELNITPGNVEKSSSLMYASVNNLRANYEFLATTNIGKNNIETCLHILKVVPEQLKETYEYVVERYGEKILKEKTSILFLKVDTIKIYEDRLKDSLDNQLLIASMTSNPQRLIADYTFETAVNDVKRIEEIIEVCNKEKISITPITFHRSVEDVKKIIELCKAKSIKVESGMFRKTADEVKDIIELCIEKGIEAKGTIFHRTADEIKDIIKLCEAKSIEATGTIFYRNADEIEQIVKVCEEMGIKPGKTVFLRTTDEVKEIAKVCEENGIKPDGTVFLKRADEIEKIVEVCKLNGIEPNGEVFNRTSDEIEDIVKVCKKRG